MIMWAWANAARHIGMKRTCHEKPRPSLDLVYPDITILVFFQNRRQFLKR